MTEEISTGERDALMSPEVVQDRICAVVVTHNRLELLKRCLAGIEAQSRLVDSILIIDNGSTDATAEWLDDSNYQFIRQENQGGASGFFTGIEKGFALDIDWVWLMDDDGVPHREALSEATAAMRLLSNRYKVLNSRVIYTDTPDETLVSAKESKFRYKGACFFNGTFVSREAYERIGNVNKDLLLWGDEVNYFMRTRRVYGVVPVINRSVHFHPPLRQGSKAPLWRQYLLARNTVFNSLNHSRFGRVGVLLGIYNTLRRVAAGEIRVDIAAMGVKDGLKLELPAVGLKDLIDRFSKYNST